MASKTYSVLLSSTNYNYIDLIIKATPNQDTNRSYVEWSVVYRLAASTYYQYNNGNKLIVKLNNKELVNSANICAISLNGNGAKKTIASGSFTYEHKSDGSGSFPVYVSFDQTQKSGNSGTISQTFICDNIARKSTLTVRNGTLGKSLNITVNRKLSDSTHTITYKCGTYTGIICDKSTSLSITDWIPSIEFANQNTTGKSVPVKFTIETFNSAGKSIGTSSHDVTCAIPDDIKPTVYFVLSDDSGYADTYGKYIQGKSKISVNITADGVYGSTIKSYKTTIDGKTYTDKSFITDYISSNKTSLEVVTTITDSRGMTNEYRQNIDVYEYSVPKIISLKAIRSMDKESFAIHFSSEVTSLDGKNTAMYYLGYKKTTDDGDYTYDDVDGGKYNNQYIVSDGKDTFQASKNSRYSIVLRITDNFGSIEKHVTGATSSVFWSIFKKDLGLALGKVAELKGVFDIGFKTKFSGGILQPVLKSENDEIIDFNDLMIPNTYTLREVSEEQYLNCPIQTGKGTLTIEECGDNKEVRQIVSICNKSKPQRFERIYSDSVWGDWICASDFGGKLLWSGEWYMSADHTATLSEAISTQTNGIVLVFSAFSNNESKNYDFNSFFVSKYVINMHNGNGHDFFMTSANLDRISNKYLVISDTQIKGVDTNTATVTNSGITINNKNYVLRYVIGV